MDFKEDFKLIKSKEIDTDTLLRVAEFNEWKNFRRIFL